MVSSVFRRIATPEFRKGLMWSRADCNQPDNPIALVLREQRYQRSRPQREPGYAEAVYKSQASDRGVQFPIGASSGVVRRRPQPRCQLENTEFAANANYPYPNDRHPTLTREASQAVKKACCTDPRRNVTPRGPWCSSNHPQAC